MLPRQVVRPRSVLRSSLLFLLPLLALFLAQLSEHGAQAAFPGANGRLVYASSYGDEVEDGIITQNPDGSCIQTILPDSGFPIFPTWSPDGTRIAFSGGATGELGKLVVMNADGSGVTVLPNELGDYDIAPAWSPEGAQLVFGSSSSSASDLYIVDADGANRTQLTDTVFDSEALPDWSPDGERIVFESNGDIYTIRPDGGGRTNLTNHPATDGWPNWSPDGSKIVFTSDRGGNPDELYVMNADGSDPAPLANPAYGETPVWSPDGMQIAYVVNQSTVAIINADGSDRRDLGLGDFPDWQPVLSPVTQLDVEKKVFMAPPPSWAFSLTGVGPFQLPGAGGCRTFSALASGSYTIQEEAVAGVVQSVSCSSGESGTTQVQVDMTAGEHVVCTFINGTLPRLEIVKEVPGPAPQAAWQFNGSGGLGAFELPAAGGSRVFEDLQPGEYTISETPVAGYASSVICADFGVPDEYSVTIQLGLGDSRICRFTNSKTATLTIEKVVNGAPPAEDWHFSSSQEAIGQFSLPAAGGAVSFDNLVPGLYFIGEDDMSGYLSAVACTNEAVGESSVAVELNGADVTCTFTNSQIRLGYLPVISR